MCYALRAHNSARWDDNIAKRSSLWKTTCECTHMLLKRLQFYTKYLLCCSTRILKLIINERLRANEHRKHLCIRTMHPYARGTVELKRRLASRQRFIPWGSKNASSPPPGLKLPMAPLPAHEDNATEEIPPDVEPLILWTPKEDSESGAKPISVDPMLLKWLRQHQRWAFVISL